MNEFEVDQRRGPWEDLGEGQGPKEVSQRLHIRLSDETHDGPVQLEFKGSSEKIDVIMGQCFVNCEVCTKMSCCQCHCNSLSSP